MGGERQVVQAAASIHGAHGELSLPLQRSAHPPSLRPRVSSWALRLVCDGSMVNVCSVDLLIRCLSSNPIPGSFDNHLAPAVNGTISMGRCGCCFTRYKNTFVKD